MLKIVRAFCPFSRKTACALSVIKYALLASGLFACSLVMLPAHSEERVDEYELKAVYIYNFSIFIEWPESAFENEKSNFNICVLGEEDPFQGRLHKTVAGETIKNREYEVLKVKFPLEGNSVDKCQIAFVTSSMKSDFGKLFRRLKGRPILTVGDEENFAGPGRGGIELFKKNEHVRLAIAADVLKQQNLKADPHLMALAEVR